MTFHGPLTREQRREALASILGHKFGGSAMTPDERDEHLEENRLARWYNRLDDDTAKYDALGNIK